MVAVQLEYSLCEHRESSQLCAYIYFVISLSTISSPTLITNITGIVVSCCVLNQGFLFCHNITNGHGAYSLISSPNSSNIQNQVPYQTVEEQHIPVFDPSETRQGKT